MSVSLPAPARADVPLQIRALDAAFGAEVLGLDLGLPLAAEDFRRIHRAHLDHHVLVFREQRITPAQQIAFSRRFGELQIHVLKQFLLPGHPEILIVSNIVENGQPVGLGDAGKFWHSDLSYKELPSLGSMLHAQELPEEGGDTLFADMHKAWDSLPEALRKAIEGRTAAHSYTARYSEPRFEGNWRPTLSAAQLAEVREVSIRSCAPTRKVGARRCSSAKVSPPASSACRLTRAPNCSPSCMRTACAPSTSTGIAGRRMTWCSGTTAR